MKKIQILFLWIGLTQSIFLLPSAASAKEGLFFEAPAKNTPFDQIDLERKKIDFLMQEIERQDGAKFWRNGTSYTPKEATEYLRMKMKWGDKGRPVKSAKDFIERIGSKSSITGRPYLIQFADGRKLEMKTFLDQKLSEWKE